jgi:colanic acid biosynthesis protein WcaH
VRKNEPFAACLRRVATSELKLQELDVKCAQLMGVWDHFYEDSAYNPEVSTHYVNLPHVLLLKQPLELDALPADQHIGWRWQDTKDAAIADDVHPYVRVYGQGLVENSYSP